MSKISAITLLSHDGEYLPESIKSYYEFVDEIVIGLDSERKTWTGNQFMFDEDKVFSALKELDADNKIEIVEDSFCIPEFVENPIENDNHERNILRNNCTHDIIISIDADEVLVNAKEFFYKHVPLTKPYLKDYDAGMFWVTPFKKIDDTTLLIADESGNPLLEYQAVLSHKSNPFCYARYTCVSASGSNRLTSPLRAYHYSLCRKNEAELERKIKNQGHANNDDGSFLELWKSVTLDNYQEVRNFKPEHVPGPLWSRLIVAP